MNEELVSIITPCFNAEKHIEETINSVISQTYKNWEMIIVDDLSDDGSRTIIDKFVEKDERIKVFILQVKGGASMARNFALQKARGRFIAFLDADDKWLKDKLQYQVKYMVENDYYFTYTYYHVIDNDSKPLNLLRKSPETVSYKVALKGNMIGCLTVMYDASAIGLIQIPNLKKRNDAALWLKALKKIDSGFLLPKALSEYRVGTNSLSSEKKILLLKYHYKLYRESESFGNLRSFYYCIWNIITYRKMKTKYEVKV